MLIFNTTFHTEDDIHEAYLNFVKDIYIPEAIKSGFLTEPRFSRIHAQHEQGGVSYSLQFRVKNSETLDHWFTNYGVLLQDKLTEKFRDKVAGFITIMEEIDI